MGISQLIDLVGRLITGANKLTALDLQEQLVSLRSELVIVEEDLVDKGRRIRSLEEAAKLRPRLVLNRSAYWEWNQSKHAYEEHPYCTRCFDADGLAIHLQEKPLDENERQSYGCPQCKQVIPVGHWFGPPDQGPQAM